VTGHAAGGASGALGSGRGVRRRVWGAGGGGRRDILGQDGVLEAIPILLGTPIGHATVLRALLVHTVLSYVLLVRDVLLGILIGRESVGMRRQRVRGYLPCRGGRQRGRERV